jgi:membrane protease YdiL (CAAX protease family)
MKIGVLHVILWTVGVFVTFGFALLSLYRLAPEYEEDLVAAAAVQSAVYLTACSIFAARRPGRTWSDTFALRGTSFWLLLCAFALGVAACLPASALADLIERLSPLSDAERTAHEGMFKPRSIRHGVLLFVFAAGIGVFAEELLFRGALYTGLRPEHTAASAGGITSVLFTLTHGEPRFFLVILLLAGLLATLRAISGSLWPSLFLHVAFNASQIGLAISQRLKSPSLGLVLGSTAIFAVLLGAFVWIGRGSALANRARNVDLEPDPGLGETES